MLTSNDYIEQPDGSWKRRNSPGGITATMEPPLLNSRLNQRINQINPIEIIDDLNNEPYHREKLGLISAREILSMPTEPLAPLWGPFIYKGSVGLWNGRTGVGKSTLLYCLLVAAATGNPFAGIPFERPLRVIYSDLETPPYLRQIKLKRICCGDGPENLLFIPRNLANFQNNIPDYRKIVIGENADILVLDTISEAFSTKDENDNSEAIRQFCTIRDFSLDTGCAVIAVHHTGKGGQNETDVFAGRGATARADKVDLVMNLYPLKEDSDVVCLAIAGKDKIAGNDSKLYLRKAGNDTFEVVDRHEDCEATVAERCKDFILSLMKDEETPTAQIQAECQKEGYSQPTVTRVVGALVDTGKIQKVRRGIYKKFESSANTPGVDDLMLDSIATAQTQEAN